MTPRVAAAAAVLLAALLLPASAQAQNTWRLSKKDRKQVAALAKTAKAGDRFAHTIEGEHWVVRTDVSVPFTAELTLFMDRFFVSFHDLLQGIDQEPRIPIKPTVEVFASRDAYSAAGHNAANRGYYTYTWNGQGEWTHLHLHTFLDKPAEAEFGRFYQPILLHEGTHVLLRRLLGKVPNAKWFDEGVATWFQFYDLSSSVKANRKRRYGRSFFLSGGHLKRAVGKGASLQALLDLDDSTWDPDSMGPIANEHYALAESLIDVCLSAKKGAELFKSVYTRLRAEETPHLSADDQATLEKAWKGHLRRLVR